MCGRQIRCTSACSASSSADGTTRRTSVIDRPPNNIGAPIRQCSGSRASAGLNAAVTASSIRSATVSVT